jgi:putative membrane protein
MKDVVHIYGPYGGFDGGSIAAMVFWLVLLVLLVVGVVFIVRTAGRRPIGPLFGPGPGLWGPPGPHHALAELDLRYARGEIERDDYLQRRADLLSQPGPGAGSPAPGPGAGGSGPTPT